MRAHNLVPILLVEDDPENRALVAGLLADSGSPLALARSGREALAKLQGTVEHMIVVSSGVLHDMSAAEMLAAVVRDGGLARRHAFVLVTPEADDIQRAREWQTRVPLFTVLEPYSYDELQQAVSRAAECVELSRELYGSGEVMSRGKEYVAADRGDVAATAGRLPAREAAKRPTSEPGPTTAVMVVGGERGIRRLVEHVLTQDPFVVMATEDEQVALACLRACAEPMVVVLNTTAAREQVDFMEAVIQEARLVRHTYVLLAPTGFWLSARQHDLLAMLNAPVVKKPFSPIALRKSIQALASPPVSAPPS
jgi:CheY-like chemotaxis protein